MKFFRGRIDIILIVFVLLCVISWVSYRMINTTRDEKHYNVSVIVNNSNSSRWTAFLEGLKQAADSENVNINFVSDASVQSVKEQKALIDRELDNGTDGIILEPYSSRDMSDIMEDISSRVPVVLLDTDISPEGVYTIVMPDNSALGEAIGKVVVNDFGSKLSKMKIGVICGNRNKNSINDRYEGFVKYIKGTDAVIEWTIDGFNVAEQLAVKQKESPVDILISLGNDETETAVDYILSQANNGNTVWLYGEGCSEKLVYYLDKGIICTLIVPNEFNMGYQSLESIADLLKYINSSKKSTLIEFLTVNKENLYIDDNQKILFPIVQ